MILTNLIKGKNLENQLKALNNSLLHLCIQYIINSYIPQNLIFTNICEFDPPTIQQFPELFLYLLFFIIEGKHNAL